MSSPIRCFSPRRQLCAAFAALSLALAGCADEPEPIINVNGEANVLPEGTIQGRVTDATTGAPLVGVKVITLAGTGKSTTTDGDGFYVLPRLPGGANYTLYFESNNYVRSIARVDLPSNAGDYPVGNATVTRNVVMAQGNGAVRGFVFANAGRPASGATVVTDLRNIGFDMVVSTKAGADGSFSLTGLPGFAAGLQAPVLVAPYDADGDGTPEYDLAERTVSIFSATTSFALINIDPTGLQLVSSNIIDGELAATEPITLVFTSALDLEKTSATLRNLTRSQTLSTVRSYDTRRVTMTVKPTGDVPLTEGDNYELTVNARSESGYPLNMQIPFQVQTEPVQPITTVLTNFKVDAPVPADWTSTSYTLSWDAVSNAAGYRIYVHDSGANAAWVRLATMGTSPAPTRTVSLPASFDIYTDDSWQTPLAFGTMLTFAAVPMDKYGNEAPLAGAATATVKDAVKPTAQTVSQADSLNNVGNPSVFNARINVGFSEYMDVATTPVLTLSSGTFSAVWSWNRDRISGYFIVSVPANTDARGSYSLSGAKDSSGNPMNTRTGTFTF